MHETHEDKARSHRADGRCSLSYFHFVDFARKQRGKERQQLNTKSDQLQHLRQQQHEILRQQNITEQATSRTTTVTTARVRFHTPPDQFSGFIQYDLERGSNKF